MHTCYRTLFDVGRAQQTQIIVRAHVETVDAIDCDAFANSSTDDALLKDRMIHVDLIDQRLWHPSIDYRCFFLHKQRKTLQVMITNEILCREMESSAILHLIGVFDVVAGFAAIQKALL